MMIVVLLALAAQTNPDSLSETAKQRAMDRRFDEAAAIWKDALGADPNHFPSLFNFGYMRYTQGQFAEAEPLLERAATIRPGDFAVHYVLGSTLVALAHREAGLDEWRKALLIQPSHVKLMQIMAVEYGSGAYFRESCDIARRALKVNALDLNANLVAVKACQDAHDPATLDIAGQAAARFPGSARTNFEYGFQLQKIGRGEESLPFIEKAMTLDPSYEEPFSFTATCC